MEWLKDKKNLPIVAALMVVILLGAGGLIAFELGLFNHTETATVTAPSTLPSGPPLDSRTGSPIGTGNALVPPSRGEVASLPVGKTVVPKTAAVKKPTSLNPLIGPDPFYIPGGQKQIAKASAVPGAPGAKPPIRDIVGPLNLFQIRPPAVPAPPSLPDQGSPQDLAANYRLAGIVTGSDGINAIVEVSGQPQTVKPGDSLPDGSRVQNIQTTSITLRTATGGTISLPLSAGDPNQGNSPYGQPPYGGRGPFGGGAPFGTGVPFGTGQPPYGVPPGYNG